MKKPILLIAFLCIALLLQAQVSQTVSVSAGGLASALTTNEKATVTNLTVKGIIDARDFKTMRDDMPVLADLDLTDVAIAAYTGFDGTSLWPENLANAIPAFAFYNVIKNKTQVSLLSIKLPSSITSIGKSAFQFCSGLTGPITFPPSVTLIEAGAFNVCGLTGILTIPSTVTSIGGNAFASCYRLTGVFISSSVTLIEDNAFTNCGLIAVDSNNPNYTAIDGVLYDKSITSVMTCPTSKTGIFDVPSSVTSIGNNAFFNCMALTSVSLPSSLKAIGKYAFSNCQSLASMILPSSVKQIGERAFSSCYALSSIKTYSSSPINLSSSLDVFNGVNKTTCTLYVPQGSKNAYKAASQWKDFMVIEEFSTTAVELINSDGLSVYPNPATDGFQIHGINGISTLGMFDFNGKLLFTKEIKSDEYISISTLPQGLYIVRITSEADMFDMKLIKR